MDVGRANDHASALWDRGYTVLEGLYDQVDLDQLSSAMTRLHAEEGSPDCYSPETKDLSPGTELSPTGLVFYNVIKRCPEDADLIVRAEVISVIRAFIGDAMWLEVAGAVIADSSRPFFQWHTHIGGPDDGTYRRQKIFPHFDEPQRVTVMLYLNDLDEDNGPLLVYPRRVTDPTKPPHAVEAEDWPGQVVLTVRRGSVVIIDQCTWHAARRKRSAGIRSFIGCYFRSPKAPATERVDEWLPGFTGGGEILQSVLPKRPPRG
jgi:Phytanoyl-CoA dioxygenase (PhyH)